jgi:hypothetical protein
MLFGCSAAWSLVGFVRVAVLRTGVTWFDSKLSSCQCPLFLRVGASNTAAYCWECNFGFGFQCLVWKPLVCSEKLLVWC